MYTYTTWVNAFSELLVVPATQADFVQILPTIIDLTEQRIYRELDLLTTVIRDQTATLTANSRNFTLPTDAGRFVGTSGFNVYTPVGTTTTRNQIVPISRDYIDAVWVTETAPTTPSIPVNYAMITDQTIIVGPAPDAAYTIEVIGWIRPNPLSATNTSTYLTTYLPDLWMAGSMIIGTGFQQNWGAQSDNPSMALSWQTTYDKFFASAILEENRKRYASYYSSSISPTPLNAPPQGRA